LRLSHVSIGGTDAGLDGGGVFNEGTFTLVEVTFRCNTPNDCTGCPQSTRWEPSMAGERSQRDGEPTAGSLDSPKSVEAIIVARLFDGGAFAAQQSVPLPLSIGGVTIVDPWVSVRIGVRLLPFSTPGDDAYEDGICSYCDDTQIASGIPEDCQATEAGAYWPNAEAIHGDPVCGRRDGAQP
jgi:hypothetical protein